MKRLKAMITELKSSTSIQDKNAEDLIRQYIFYSPKMPLRLHQEQILATSKAFTLPVADTYFTGAELTINCFSWGNGKTKILLTHGWASKAADFFELITELQKLDDVEIIAFDAPGNGSSESEFSNLMLYAESVKSIHENYAKVDVIIGHSLGCMANVIAIQESEIQSKLLISIAPLIRLKENFEQSMDSVNIPATAKANFFKNFSDEFPVAVDYFNLEELYTLQNKLPHFLAYDKEDHISPYAYLKPFLDKNQTIEAKTYEGAGHYKILKSPEVIADVVAKIKSTI
ncbi:alpha/beta fold hydrolase [Pedobacter jejuensis]|uniref:Alpha/beta hydrolase n=1 Tax=Pedobacter jejuensis TaxID=1268550 RepID=A0A3N0BWU1_9SPHI|nr:alpha/beta hydrolase [Pedobacter jejuensis]RNL54187.1 alpha/beta hydrolase [Pedobacter jejuensis]